MNSKSSLALMEQLIMLLIFALAAALCLQVFALSSRISHRCEAEGQAATAVQNTAETVKLLRGDVSQYPRFLEGAGSPEEWRIGYDDSWNVCDADQAQYIILVYPEPTSLPTLGQASVRAETKDGDALFGVTVAWQEAEYE